MPSPYSYPIGVDLGAYVPTTNVYDQQNIYELDVNSDDFKEFLVKLRQSMTDMANVLNIKDTGYYPSQEFTLGQVQPFTCGQGWFQTEAAVPRTSNINMRPVLRQTYNCGALLNNANKPIPHGITIDANHPIRFTRIFGTANDVTGFHFIPLPCVQVGAGPGPVEIDVDNININIRTSTNMTAYTICYVTLEYITTGSATD